MAKIRPEVRAEFEKVIRRKYKAWQKKHPDVEVKSSTIHDPIKLMIIAMAMKLEN